MLNLENDVFFNYNEQSVIEHTHTHTLFNEQFIKNNVITHIEINNLLGSYCLRYFFLQVIF